MSDEQQKAIDEVTEEYNSLSETVATNTQEQRENTQAIEDNLQAIEDKTVEFYDTMKEAIVNAEKKKIRCFNGWVRRRTSSVR